MPKVSKLLAGLLGGLSERTVLVLEEHFYLFAESQPGRVVPNAGGTVIEPSHISLILFFPHPLEAHLSRAVDLGEA
jgi:hypothetical protein